MTIYIGLDRVTVAFLQKAFELLSLVSPLTTWKQCFGKVRIFLGSVFRKLNPDSGM